MKKIPKKLVIFLIALAAVVLIGVLVMLLLPGREPGPSNPPGTTAPASPSPGVSETPSETPEDTGTIEQTETVEGTIYTVTVPGGSTVYSVTVGSGSLEISRTPDDILLTSPDDGEDTINITFHQGAAAVSLAPKIMDRYIKYNEFEQSGLNDIPGTEIAGETVTASDGSTLVTAWLVTADGGVLAVVLRHDVSDTGTETARLYDVLKTLKFDEQA